MGASETDIAYLNQCVDIARAALARGDRPIGSILVTADGRIVEASNTQITEKDPTGHAETNLVRVAGREIELADFETSTLYTSAEPCAMCSGAIFLARIPRVVYSNTIPELATPRVPGTPTLGLTSRDVFAKASIPIEVVGPVDLG